MKDRSLEEPGLNDAGTTTSKYVAPKTNILVIVTSLLLALYGLSASIYLTYDHYSNKSPAGCPDKGFINCAKVTTSPQSLIFHIPVALLGLLFFVTFLPLCIPQAWNSPSKKVAYLRLIMVITGVLFILYLVAMELLVIKSLCLWCTSVHVTTFLLFMLVVMSFNQTGYILSKYYSD